MGDDKGLMVHGEMDDENGREGDPIVSISDRVEVETLQFAAPMPKYFQRMSMQSFLRVFLSTSMTIQSWTARTCSVNWLRILPEPTTFCEAALVITRNERNTNMERAKMVGRIKSTEIDWNRLKWCFWMLSYLTNPHRIHYLSGWVVKTNLHPRPPFPLSVHAIAFSPSCWASKRSDLPWWADLRRHHWWVLESGASCRWVAVGWCSPSGTFSDRSHAMPLLVPHPTRCNEWKGTWLSL